LHVIIGSFSFQSCKGFAQMMALIEQQNKKQQNKSEHFRALHHGRKTLLLPNAWDVASARIFEEAGFRAIATTSGGIAFTLGYPDGQRIPREEMLKVVNRIATAVKVAVTADVEAGYGNRPEDAAITARAVIEAGAVGMNLEDATNDPENPIATLTLQLEKIAAVRQEANTSKLPIVLNARTDIYLMEIGEPNKRYEEALRRLSAFREAGADCVFAPGLKDPVTIKRLVADLDCPLNILAGPGSPSVPELENLGVARVSLGSAPMRAASGLVRRIAEELKTSGTYESLGSSISYAEMNSLLE
jgi:2-methylisocitrate lyase-like PEP mutase family enzyme